MRFEQIQNEFFFALFSLKSLAKAKALWQSHPLAVLFVEKIPRIFSAKAPLRSCFLPCPKQNLLAFARLWKFKHTLNGFCDSCQPILKVTTFCPFYWLHHFAAWHKFSNYIIEWTAKIFNQSFLCKNGRTFKRKLAIISMFKH